MDRLKDRIAIVTGAAQGIGRGIADALAQEGAVVVLLDLSDAVKKTASDIRQKGYRTSAFTVDVSNTKQVKQAVRQIAEEHRKIDILVNNAGMAYFALFVDMPDEMRDKIFNVNFNGMWNCTKATIPFMLRQKYGRIVNISSVTGPRVATPGLSAYAATKGAISGFTRTLALEVAASGITDTSRQQRGRGHEIVAWLVNGLPVYPPGCLVGSRGIQAQSCVVAWPQPGASATWAATSHSATIRLPTGQASTSY